MARTAATTVPRAYPKRKRAEISYHESSSDESEVDDENDTSDEELTAAKRKKLKTSRITISDKPLPKRKIFPFTSLPAELKNQIYALVLTDPNGMYLISKTKRFRRTVQRSVMPPDSVITDFRRRNRNYYLATLDPSDTSVPALVPNILLLNQAIYAETQPILYAGNTFSVEDTTAMHAFLSVIGPKNRATITDLTIKAWGYARAHKALNFPAFTMLVGAVSLTRLHLDCKIAWGGPKKVAKQLYRDGFHWLEAMEAAKGSSKAAVDVVEISEKDLGVNYRHRWSAEVVEESGQERMEQFRAELRKMLS